MEMSRGRPTSGQPDSRQPGWGIDGPLPTSDLRRRRRSSWNPATWTPVTASLAPNRDYRAPGTAGGRRFASTEHLAAEAVAAFVDAELGMTAHLRATQHLAQCRECMAAVDAQVTARTRLRAAGDVSMPAGLLGQLSQIPTREIDVTAMSSDTPTDRVGFDPADGGSARPNMPTDAFESGSTRARMSRWRGR
ncbi:hypothetical protein VX037_09825 [Gordonia sp. Z-3]|uniref:Anti-sigma-E factor RseA n=1 Tax=Gordonia tangerina TaxID=2911060 RepID=A0ABS9DKN7_9ACTN|nr:MULTISPECIES: hypothetical protein [Gordonia]MCF3939112.1 hypothetical protein [Gordonia tangerina]MED5801320.1 hypothetical protein [Gordonia sp. Z-3]